MSSDKKIIELFRQIFPPRHLNIEILEPINNTEEKILELLRLGFISCLNTLEINTPNTDYVSLYKQLLDSHLLIKEVYAAKYSWAIPTLQVLREISQHQKIIELYAGTGYWAKLISAYGIDIRCYDNFSSHYTTESYGKFHKVQHIKNLDYFVNKNLPIFMSWIPYGDTDCVRYLTKLKPHTILLIGEGRGGCTASDDLFDFLNKHYVSETVINFPTWFGYKDFFAAWRKK